MLLKSNNASARSIKRDVPLTSLNFFEDSSDPPLRSGCHFRACKQDVNLNRCEYVESITYHFLVCLLDFILPGIPRNTQGLVVVGTHTWECTWSLY